MGLMLGASCALLSGCVNLSAVADFAQESSLLTANQAMLDDSAAQATAHLYDRSVEDPDSDAFKAHLIVTRNALAALNAYMNVLTRLTDRGQRTMDPETTKIEGDLALLNVADPKVKAGFDAASALAGILLDGVIRRQVAKLAPASAASIETITLYLADQAQVTANTYSQGANFSTGYWTGLKVRSGQDVKFCQETRLCDAVDALATRTMIADREQLKAKSRAAAAAAEAFRKIGKDHQALVDALKTHKKLDDKGLIELLKADEPLLKAAIQNLKAL
jgi:hypothetical protein